jgi:hypothetical protein
MKEKMDSQFATSDAEVDISNFWETVIVEIKTTAQESVGYYDVKRHKQWFNEGCSTLSDQWKRAKLQCLQCQSEINGDNLNNIRRETSRHFKNIKREYL